MQRKIISYLLIVAMITTVLASSLMLSVKAYAEPVAGNVSMEEWTVYEDFTSDASNFIPVSGGTWTVSDGKYILSNPANGPILGNISVHKYAVVGDFYLAAVVNIVSNPASVWDDAVVIFGYLNSENYCFVSLNESNDGATNGLFKVVGGVQEEIVDFPELYTPGKDYVVEIIKTGTNLVVKVDGVVMADVILEDIRTDGRFGFGSKNDSVIFDNLGVIGTVISDDGQAPPVPTNLNIGYVSYESIQIKWDKPEGVTEPILYKVFRDSVEVATTSNTYYTDYHLSRNTQYSYYVKAMDIFGNVSDKSDTVTVRTLEVPSAAFPFDQGNIDIAVATPLLRYTYFLEWNDLDVRSTAAFFYLTVACTYDPYYKASDGTVIKDRVLKHIRKLLADETHTRTVNIIQSDGSTKTHVVEHTNEPSFSGQLDTEGYGQAIIALALIKNIPEIWNELTEAEKNKITLLMKCALIAANWSHDDDNNFNCGIIQDYNYNKNWNPNMQEGGIGAAIASAYYLGGAEEANNFLKNFDYDEFMNELREANLKSAMWTFSQAGKEKLEDATKNKGDFTYRGITLDNLYGWVAWRAKNAMFTKIVKAEVTDGKGNRAYIVSGAEDLPNQGEVGMCHEFDSADAYGMRSDVTYVYNGWKNTIANRLFLELIGEWKGEDQEEIERLYDVGSTDLIYKLQKGYIGYQKGKPQSLKDEKTLESKGYYLIKELWLNLLSPERPLLVTLDRNQAKLEIGQTLQLFADYSPKGAVVKRIVWESSDPSVASVDENGIVTALLPGIATITARVEGTSYKESCELEVVADISSIQKLVENFKTSGELDNPLYKQLSNSIRQAEFHKNSGRESQAIKHLKDSLKHLENEAMDKFISDNAKNVLKVCINYLVDVWENE